MEASLWIVWLLVGSILLIGELLTAGFFLICFTLGAYCAAWAAWIGIPLEAQGAVFIAVSTVSVLFARKVANRFTKEPPRKAGVDRLFGEEAVVTERIDSVTATGRVRIQHEEWRATAVADDVFEINDRVVVTGARGTHLQVALPDI